jgi:putative hemolysin
VFYIGDRKINSLMTHRKSVVYLPLHSNKKVKEFMHELHSVSLPVYNSNYDDIVGVVNLKKYLAH